MLAMLGLGGAELMLILILMLLALVVNAFWIWMIISAVQNKGLTDNERLIWILVVVFLQLLGGIIYYFAAHPKRKTPLIV